MHGEAPPPWGRGGGCRGLIISEFDAIVWFGFLSGEDFGGSLAGLEFWVDFGKLVVKF